MKCCVSWCQRLRCFTIASLPMGFSLLAAIPTVSSAASPSNGPHTLSGESKITVYFDTLADAAVNDGNRIDGLVLDDIPGIPTVATETQKGPKYCGDPDEFFGEAEGYPDVTKAPRMVAGGERASWIQVGHQKKPYIASADTYTGVATCPGTHLDGQTRTRFSVNANSSGALTVERTFRFSPGLGVVQNTGLRAFMPRTLANFHYVLIPNAAGQVVTYDANNCTSTPCAVTDWNGIWFADDRGDGVGILVIRSPQSTAPAFVGIQSGGAANENYTSIVLNQPTAGWSGYLAETEYVCPYYPDSWNPTKPPLPPNCTPQPANATQKP